ncbi:MAG: hypothetical protein PHV63_02925 [Candidatus Daviesbacteria bacterium]|nr:hypothetical protein [Candidatus Daviesbacteria bacterium]
MNVKRRITDFVLLALEKSIDGYIRFEDFAYHHYSYHYGIPELKKSALSQALKRLRKDGLIELVSDEKLAYRITDKGKEKAVLASLKFDDNKWDGKWRLVIFDVPEKRRRARDLLRSKLKQWGFVYFQQSVWGTKKNCTKALRDFIKSVGIEDWVMVVESDNLSRSH